MSQGGTPKCRLLSLPGGKDVPHQELGKLGIFLLPGDTKLRHKMKNKIQGRHEYLE